MGVGYNCERTGEPRMYVVYTRDDAGELVWMLPIAMDDRFRVTTAVTKDPGSRRVARWQTRERAEAAAREYAKKEHKPADEYRVQTQVDAVRYVNERLGDYGRDRLCEIDTGGD